MGNTYEIIDHFEDDLFGIPIVIHHSVHRETNDAGRVLITIPHEDRLGAAIAMARALIPVKLKPEDIRMMRKTLGMRAKDFAAQLDMSPARLSRLEKSTQGLGSFTELNMRQFVCARLKKVAPAIDYDPGDLATMRLFEGEVRPLEFELVSLKQVVPPSKSDEWDLAKAA